MNEGFTDKDLGEVYILRNARARNVIARRKSDFIQLTVPINFSMRQILDVFEKMKSRLENLKSKPVLHLSPDVEFKTPFFVLKLEKKDVHNYYMSLKDGVLSIACPMNTNFSDQTVQSIIRDLMEKAMRYEAKRVFPSKLSKLAQQYNFKYTDLKINKSRTRWGSCSSKRSINLSYFCILLPEYLIDFIMLHELCHTIEMNHGTNFWLLLDKVTNNQAKQLTQELKNYVNQW